MALTNSLKFNLPVSIKLTKASSADLKESSKVLVIIALVSSEKFSKACLAFLKNEPDTFGAVVPPLPLPSPSSANTLIGFSSNCFLTLSNSANKSAEFYFLYFAFRIKQ